MNANPPYNLFNLPPHTGEQLRDIGITKAVTHADALNEGWSDKAYEFLLKFTKSNPVFMIEDVRLASEGIIPEPPTKRAWGSIAVRAARKGIIKQNGFSKVKNPKAHCANAACWVVCGLLGFE